MSSHDINSTYRAKALLDAFQQEYPFATRGLTLEMVHSILNNHGISVRISSKFGKRYLRLVQTNAKRQP